MIQLATDFNRKFTLPQYGSLRRVKSDNHNVDIGMEKLIRMRIMKESLNNQGSKVYGLVDMIHIHIQYDKDDSIEDELNKLFLQGNAAIEARNIKKGKGKRK